MEKLIENIFLFYRKRRFTFVLTMLVFLCSFGYLTTQLGFEENISKMLPDKSNIMRVNQTIESSGFMDRLFIHVYADSAVADALTSFADSLATRLNNSPDSGLIRALEYRLSEEDEQAVFEFVQAKLPLLLEEEDYPKLNEKLSSESIDNSVDAGYQLLMTPAGAWSGPLFRRDPLNLTQLGLNKLKQLQIDDNIQVYNGYFLSKDKQHLLMWIIPSNEPNETTENAKLLARLDHELAVLNNEQIRAEYFGTTAVAVGNARQIKSDIQTTVAIAFTLLLLFLTFYFRKALTILYLFTPVIFGGLLALALLYLFKGSISAISLGIGSLIVGITIDFSLHFLNHFKEDNDNQKVLKATSRPILTSCLTTASAFLCLTLVESEALTDLGIFAGVSVIGAALATLLVLPQLIKPSKAKAKPFLIESALHRWSSYPIDKNLKLIGVLAVISIVCLFFFKDVQFNGNMEKMNFMSPEVEAAQNRLSVLNKQNEKSIYLIAQSNNLEQALRRNDEVGAVMNDLVKEFPKLAVANSSSIILSAQEQAKRLERWKNFWGDSTIEKTREKLLTSGERYKFKGHTFQPFYQFLSDRPEAFELTDIQNLKALNIEAFCGEKEGQYVFFNPVRINGESLTSVKQYLKEQNIEVFDKAEFANSIVSSLQNDFSGLIWASLLVVFVILLIFFRHSLLAILTLLPVLVTWVWVTGIMSMFGIEFNIFNIIVSSLIFGLGIDYAIFITSGLMHELKTGERKISVYKTSILLSALTTICGVGALIFAKHPALYSMAFISILGIGVAVLISFTLQAFLIRLLIVNRSQRGVQPFTSFTLLATIWTFIYFLFGCVISFLLGYIILPIVPVNKKTKIKWVTWFSSKWTRSLTQHQIQIKQDLNFPSKEELSKPAVIILNHESFLDILMVLSMSPKNILLTNDWVYNSPFFGKVIQYIGFYPVSQGFEQALPHLKEKVADGYNICVFPEGTRSKTPRLSRFHKGAFYIAQQLNMDIVPILLHGFGHIMTKGDDFLLKLGRVKSITLPRIKHNDLSWGSTDRERYKNISRHFKQAFYKLRQEEEDLSYYRNRLSMNYIYKGIELERLNRRILKENESTFNTLNQHLPDKNKLVVVGDELGLLALFLSYRNEKRHVTGLQKTEHELELVENCFSANRVEHMRFQLLHDQVDYQGVNHIIIDEKLCDIHDEDLNFIITQCYNRMESTCSLILSQCKSVPELGGTVDQVSENLVRIAKPLG